MKISNSRAYLPYLASRKPVRKTGLLQNSMMGSLLFMAMSSSSFAESGSIVGQIVDENNHTTYVGNAVVFLCDAENGLPILKSTKQALVTDPPSHFINDLWYTETSDRGGFNFQDVPIGHYRIVVQSWSGTKGLPSFNDKPSTIVVLHGIAENVEVKAGEQTRVYPRKLGEGVLKIVCDPKENHHFLFISQKPRMGEAVLGPPAWGPGFLSGLIEVTQMEKYYVTLIGLPEGKEIHVGLFNYDNNAGLGGATYLIGKDPVVSIQIYASWSNGKYNPPERLEKLTDYFDQKEHTASKLIGLDGNDRKNHKAIWNKVLSEENQLIEVEGVGKFKLIDILAAKQYQRLRESHRKRLERNK